jgi:hypothetical protein
VSARRRLWMASAIAAASRMIRTDAVAAQRRVRQPGEAIADGLQAVGQRIHLGQLAQERLVEDGGRV